MVRIAVLLALIVGSLAVGPASAQFGNLFGNQQPPRPPADVPNGSFPPQPPPVGGNGGQYAPPPSAGPPPSGIQAQPLPPPPGASAAPPPPRPPGAAPQVQPAARANPQQTGPAPQQAGPAAPQLANPPPPQPADTSPKPDDTIVTEMPTQKIANGRAVFSGLDKITGRIISFDAAIGETVQFGALQVTARVCYTRPPTEATNTDAFVEVDEVTLKGEIKRIFTGWMFAASPGLHAVEHPIYDVWLTDCASPPSPAPVAQSTPPPAAPAGAQPPGQPRARAPLPQTPTTQQPKRPAVPAIAPLSPPPVTDD
jgi:hypothetical protein